MDAALRELERRFQASRDPADGARFLIAAERSGDPGLRPACVAVRAALHPVRPELARVFELANPEAIARQDEAPDVHVHGHAAYCELLHGRLVAMPIEDVEALVGDRLFVGDLIVTGGWDRYRGLDTLIVGEQLDGGGLRRVLIEPFRGEYYAAPPTYLCWPTRVPSLQHWDEHRVDSVPLDPDWVASQGPELSIGGQRFARPALLPDGCPPVHPHHEVGVLYASFCGGAAPEIVETLERGWGKIPKELLKPPARSKSTKKAPTKSKKKAPTKSTKKAPTKSTKKAPTKSKKKAPAKSTKRAPPPAKKPRPIQRPTDLRPLY